MAYIDVIVTDMGNGAAFCSNCDYCLDGGDPTVRRPAECPKCKEKFNEPGSLYVNSGGSDF